MFAFSALEPRRTGIVTQDQPDMSDYLEASAEQGLHDSLFSTISRMEEYRIAAGGSMLDPDTATQKYGLPGLKFTSPINEERAQLLHDRQRAQLDRDYFLNEGHHNLLQSTAGFTTSMASSMLNPLDFSTAFIPITRAGGEAANILGRGALRRTLNEGLISLPESFAKRDLSVAAINNAIFQTGAEGVRWGEVLQTHDKNYTLGDSLLNIMGGTLIGTGIHAGVKYASKLWSRLTPETKEVLAQRAVDNFVKGDDNTDLHKYANLDENVIRDQLMMEMTKGMEESTGKMSGEAQRIRDTIMSQYETGPRSTDEWVELARRESKEPAYSNRANEYGEGIRSPEELKSVLAAADSLDESYKNLTNLSLPDVNQRDVVTVARDFMERIAQLKNPTDAQVTKSRLIQAILRNPTDSAAMNLAALLDLRFNPKAGEFPTKYSHISDRELPEEFSLPPQQDRYFEELERDIQGRNEISSAAHFLREVHQRATGTGHAESEVKAGAYEPYFTQQGEPKQIMREGRAQEVLNDPEILRMIQQEKMARIKSLVDEELAKRRIEQNATNRRGPESDRTNESKELENESHVDYSQIKSWSPLDDAKGAEALSRVIDEDINSLKADVGLTKAQVAEEAAKIEGGIKIKLGKINPEEGAVHIPLPKGKLSALAPELAKSKEFGFPANKRILGTELMNRLRNLIAPGEFAHYEGAGLKEFLKESKTTEDLAKWLGENAPKVEVQTMTSIEGGGKDDQEYVKLRHEFIDKLSADDLENVLEAREKRNPRQFLIDNGFKRSDIDKALRYIELDDKRSNEPGTHWSEIAPKFEEDMPGYAEIAVTIPIPKTASKFTEEARQVNPGLGAKFPSSHEFPPNTVGFARGYVDTLPSGERVFHVVEVQSDWAKEMRRRFALKDVPPDIVEGIEKYNKEHSDPLLQHYERLVLKSVIDHARKEGINKVAISDAETAMMTEGHDQFDNLQRGTDQIEEHLLENYAKEHQVTLDEAQAYFDEHPELFPDPIISEEEGMRLHYDQILPKIMRELTGDRGKLESLGEHRMAIDFNSSQLDGNDKLIKKMYREDLIFQTPQGEPKIDITARVYDVSKAREGFSLFGSDRPVEAERTVKNPDKLIQQAIDCATKKLL